jgi:hypothetical protein
MPIYWGGGATPCWPCLVLGILLLALVMTFEGEGDCPPPPPECLNCADGFKNSINGEPVCAYEYQSGGGGEGGGPGI